MADGCKRGGLQPGSRKLMICPWGASIEVIVVIGSYSYSYSKHGTQAEYEYAYEHGYRDGYRDGTGMGQGRVPAGSI